ncbi:MAG: tetratricopeptide repeat protein [Ignavibacteria bacterium]
MRQRIRIPESDTDPLLEEDLRKYPDRKNGLYNLGLAYFRTGRTDEAIKHFSKTCFDRSGKCQAFYILGTVYEKAKIFPKAMESYQASLTIFPDNIKVLNSLGNLFYNNGKIGDALAAYTLITLIPAM